MQESGAGAGAEAKGLAYFLLFFSILFQAPKEQLTKYLPLDGSSPRLLIVKTLSRIRNLVITDLLSSSKVRRGLWQSQGHLGNLVTAHLKTKC